MKRNETWEQLIQPNERLALIVFIGVCLIERHHNLHRLLLNALCGGNAQLLALLSGFIVVVAVVVAAVVAVVAVVAAVAVAILCICICICIRIRIVPTGRAVARVHVVLYGPIILFNVGNHPVFQRPLEEIQLPDRGLNEGAVHVRNRDAVPPAKRVKPALAVRLQLELVVHVHLEAPVDAHFVHGEELLGVIRGKPVNDTERNGRLPVDDSQHFFQVVVLVIELH